MALSSRGALAAPLLPVGVTPGPAMAGEAQKSSPGSQGPRKRWQRPSPAAPQRPPESGRGREERAGPDPCLAADSPGRSRNGSSFVPLVWMSLPLPSAERRLSQELEFQTEVTGQRGMTVRPRNHLTAAGCLPVGGRRVGGLRGLRLAQSPRLAELPAAPSSPLPPQEKKSLLGVAPWQKGTL